MCTPTLPCGRRFDSQYRGDVFRAKLKNEGLDDGIGLLALKGQGDCFREHLPCVRASRHRCRVDPVREKDDIDARLPLPVTRSFDARFDEIGVDRRFSSHGLRRTANDLIRRVASGEVARAITGHVTERMTEHYSHVDTGEKRAAMEGVLRLVQVGPSGPAKSTTEQGRVVPQRALNWATF